MIRLYSPAKTEEIIQKLEPVIRQVSADYGVPGAAICAILFREIKEIDLMDAAADAAVRFGWFGRSDSSTGYMQIFGRVAIRALRFAQEHGIETPDRLGMPDGLDENVPADVRTMWLRLNRDTAFNLRMGTLNLLAAAHEAAGEADFGRLGADGMKRAFSRYNANTCSVTSYGEEVWGYYLKYGGESREGEKHEL
ncbi:MAG: hypothetical protein K6A33_11735 [Clostridiales bacterium]|nr:hypothetical protein [Clostridiales bacterium]